MAGIILLSTLLLTVAWGITFQRLEAERTLLMVNATKQQENLANIIAENLAQILDRGRLIASTANRLIGRQPGDLRQTLSAMRSIDPAILRIALYDHEGMRVFASSSEDDLPAMSAAVKALLARHSEDSGQEIEVLPSTNAFGQAWEIPLLFPVLDASGANRGVLLAVLDVGYFLGLYHRIDFGNSGIIRILNSDGQALAEAHRAGITLIEDSSQKFRLPPSTDRNQSFSEIVANVSRPYLSSYRRLTNYPLGISVVRELSEMQVEHAKSRSRVLMLLTWFSLVLIVASIWIIANFRRQGRLLRSIEQMNLSNLALIEQLEDEKNRAFKLAAHDHLTGLNNRRMFQEMAASHLSRAKRSHSHYALIFLDLDRFKAVNDTLGHHVGDLLLQAIAARLRHSLRESDLVARLGGDEFAILLTGLDSINDVSLIVEKLIASVSQPCIGLDGHDVHVTPSIGIAIFPRDGAEFEALCRSADSAMYQAKRSGRGRYVFYDPSLNRHDDRQFILEQRLPQAIADGELVLHFQPKIGLVDNRIVGFEALVRWQHPQLGLVYPDDFIPLAESCGAIGALGNWVIDACCRQQAIWRAAGLAIVPIAFNVSAKQLLDDSLPAIVKGFLAKHGIEGALLEAEITETTLVESIQFAGSILAALETLGLSIALDDFGNGFSNFSYIRTMPIHRIKIDRSFISDIHKSRENSAIVDSIISLAHKLHKKVIAEGVETREQIMHLKTVGCDEIQGYYISRPVPAEDAEKLLARSILEAP